MGGRSKTPPAGWEDLVAQAVLAREKAHAPYSGFFVGCALEDESGRVHLGCNVENANYSESLCAERTAVVKMVSEGGRQAMRVALITSSTEPCFPCGSCRQVLSEFGEPQVLTTDVFRKEFRLESFDALLPLRFTARQLKQKGQE